MNVLYSIYNSIFKCRVDRTVCSLRPLAYTILVQQFCKMKISTSKMIRLWATMFLIVRVGAHSISNIIINAFGTTVSRFDTNTTDSIQAGIESKLGSMHLNEVTFVTAHNAHANSYASGENIAKQIATNQKYSVYHQLKYTGVRGLMLDIEYDGVDSDIRLVHGNFDFNSLSDVIAKEIVPFLEEDTDAIITIDLETRGDREILREQLKFILDRHPEFARRIFRITDPRWLGLKEWPMLRHMRKADQRVVILCDSHEVRSEELGIMWRNDITMVGITTYHNMHL